MPRINTLAHQSGAGAGKLSGITHLSNAWDVEDAAREELKPLTREEVQQLRTTTSLGPLVSLWRVLAGQLAAGVVVAVLAWALTGKQSAGLSALYGSLAVVIPAVFFARGLSRQRTASGANSALVGFMVWELVKVVLTVAMLIVAPGVVSQLSWLALLAGFVVTMKVYWVAVWVGLGRKSSVENY